MGPIAEAFTTIRIDKSKLSRELLGVRRSLLTSVRGMSSAVKGIFAKAFSFKTLFAGLVSGYAFRRFITPFASFEAEMDKSLAIMKGAVGREKELAALASATARKWGRSHSEMARSYFYLASAGLDAEKSIKVFDTTATFATAATMDMAEATDLLTDSLSALGWASKDPAKYGQNMRKLSDMIVHGNTLANTSVRQLAEALTQRGATAIQRYQIPVEQGIGFLLMLADVGYAKAGEAGTQFSILLEGLTRGWMIHGKELKKAGIGIYDTAGRMNDLDAIMAQFNRRLGRESPEAQEMFLMQTLAIDKRAARVLMTAMKAGDKVRQHTMDMYQHAGQTNKIANTIMGNLRGIWNRFKADVEGLSIAINSYLKPIYDALVEFGSAVSNAFRRVFEDERGMAGFKAMVDSIAKSIRNVTDALKEFGLRDMGGILWQGVKSYGSAITTIMVDIAERMAIAFCTKVAEGLPKAFKYAWEFQGGLWGRRGQELAGQGKYQAPSFFEPREPQAAVAGKAWAKANREMEGYIQGQREKRAPSFHEMIRQEAGLARARQNAASATERAKQAEERGMKWIAAWERTLAIIHQIEAKKWERQIGERAPVRIPPTGKAGEPPRPTLGELGVPNIWMPPGGLGTMAGTPSPSALGLKPGMVSQQAIARRWMAPQPTQRPLGELTAAMTRFYRERLKAPPGVVQELMDTLKEAAQVGVQVPEPVRMRILGEAVALEKIEAEQEKPAPTWQRAGIREMHAVLQDAIVSSEERKLQKQLAQSAYTRNETLASINTGVKNVVDAVKKINTGATEQ